MSLEKDEEEALSVGENHISINARKGGVIGGEFEDM